MLSRWPIRYKLLLGMATLCAMLAALAFSAFRGPYAYRHLTRSISNRALELGPADELTRTLGELRTAYERMHRADLSAMTGDVQLVGPVERRDEFRRKLSEARRALELYTESLKQNGESDLSIDDDSKEWDTVREIRTALENLDRLQASESWLLKPLPSQPSDAELQQLADLHHLSGMLPTYFRQKMLVLSGEARGQYRAWIYVTWVSSILAAILLVGLIAFFYVGMFRPLRVLVEESRKITAGNLRHRIIVSTKDEVAELATAINDMTEAFQRIRDTLDEQVRQQSRELIRSEQMASVGFLAAGVAHEINNPLASIAWCAESLDGRLPELVGHDDEAELDPSSDLAVVCKYLRRIQEEAFRCKGITEKLLDFSRMGDVRRQATDLAELVQDVVDMVRTIGRYKDRRVEFVDRRSVVAQVNPQEIKQVVLNLLTNALDSLDPGGHVTVHLRSRAGRAELDVVDDGCGMTAEVQQHLFEPFFTRRRDGQGTGLGLSISYRIVQDHGGTIVGHSAGPGCGAKFSVELPLESADRRAASRSGSSGTIPSPATSPAPTRTDSISAPAAGSGAAAAALDVRPRPTTSAA